MFLGAVSMDFVSPHWLLCTGPIRDTSVCAGAACGLTARASVGPPSAPPRLSQHVAVLCRRQDSHVHFRAGVRPQRARALTRSVLFLSRTKGGPQIAYERSFRWKLAHFRYLCQVLQW